MVTKENKEQKAPSVLKVYKEYKAFKAGPAFKAHGKTPYNITKEISSPTTNLLINSFALKELLAETTHQPPLTHYGKHSAYKVSKELREKPQTS